MPDHWMVYKVGKSVDYTGRLRQHELGLGALEGAELVLVCDVHLSHLDTAMPQTNGTPKTVMLCTSCKEGPRVVAHHAASSPQDAPPPLGLPRPPAAGCALRSCCGCGGHGRCHTVAARVPSGPSRSPS